MVTCGLLNYAVASDLYRSSGLFQLFLCENKCSTGLSQDYNSEGDIPLIFLFLPPLHSLPSSSTLYPFPSPLPPLLSFHLRFPLLSPMIQLGSLGSDVSCPSGSRRSPTDKRFLANLEHKIKHLTTTILTAFFNQLTVKPLHKLICI